MSSAAAQSIVPDSLERLVQKRQPRVCWACLVEIGFDKAVFLYLSQKLLMSIIFFKEMLILVPINKGLAVCTEILRARPV